MTTATTQWANVVSLRDYRTNGEFSWANDNFNPWSFQVLLKELADEYFTDPMSGFATRRWVTQKNYRSLTRRVLADLGDYEMKDITVRLIKERYAVWSADGKLTMGHGIVCMLRVLIGFGASILENEQCQRIRGGLSSTSFPSGKQRETFMEPFHAAAIREQAMMDGAYSIALAQAIQFDCALRQKDVIGEWIPVNADARASKIIVKDLKWVGGITVEEISDKLILVHETSKRGKVLTFPLKSCPMVMEEIHHLPKAGPVIIDPRTSLPFRPWNYTRLWRDYATKANVPRNVWNMDTRAGRITSVLAKGVPIEDARKLAGHAQSTTTTRYSRGNEAAIARALDAVLEVEAA